MDSAAGLRYVIVHRYPDLEPKRIVEVLSGDLGWLESLVEALYEHVGTAGQ